MMFRQEPASQIPRASLAVVLACLASLAPLALPTWTHARLHAMARDPYVGAIVVHAGTGEVLVEDHADAKSYPASVLKLMTLLIVLETLERGEIHRSDAVTVTAEAARTGGSQVYLAEHEVFTVEELLQALMIQSANDAAVALAVFTAGSKAAFVDLMNQRARALGMRSTTFHSPHGLPPARGQEPDVATARDLARLSIEVLKYPDVLRYSATKEQPFRNGTFMMRTHNNLLGRFDGCDGLKTGYFSAAGFSIAATAVRDGERLVTVVLGSKSKAIRDRKAAELLSKGFSLLPEMITAGPPEPMAAER